MHSELTVSANLFVRRLMPETAWRQYAAVTQLLGCVREAGGVAAASRLFAFAVLLLPVTGAAQSPAAAPTRVISSNPFMLLSGHPSIEFEQRLTTSLAVGFAASSAVSGSSGSHMDAKVRFYPNEKAMEGFGMAGSLGVTNRTRTTLGCLGTCSYRGEKQRTSVPNTTIELSYQWLLGSKKSTAIALGGGLRRIFASDADWGSGNRILSTARFNIGYAF